jgi:hypothetical protein
MNIFYLIKLTEFNITHADHKQGLCTTVHISKLDQLLKRDNSYTEKDPEDDQVEYHEGDQITNHAKEDVHQSPNKSSPSKEKEDSHPINDCPK